MVENAALFGQPRIWGWLFACPFAVAFVTFATASRPAAAATAGCAALAWMIAASVRPPDRHRVARAAITNAVLSLTTTWLSSTVVAFAVSGDTIDDGWVTIWLVAAPNIGGLLALFRSVQTRVETSATLRELSGLRVSALSAPVVQVGAQTHKVRSLDDVIANLEVMLQLAVGLRLLDEGVDRASVWALDDDGWWICASTSLSASSQRFRQPVLDRTRDGAGMVANFAIGDPRPQRDQIVRGDVLLVGKNVTQHPWFAPNPAEVRRSEGIAIVRLRHRGRVAGALCFTSRDQHSASQAIPVIGSRAEEIVDILTRWAQAFGIGLAALYDIREAQEVSHDEGP
jgi:hypothetical protein